MVALVERSPLPRIQTYKQPTNQPTNQPNRTGRLMFNCPPTARVGERPPTVGAPPWDRQGAHDTSGYRREVRWTPTSVTRDQANAIQRVEWTTPRNERLYGGGGGGGAYGGGRAADGGRLCSHHVRSGARRLLHLCPVRGAVRRHLCRRQLRVHCDIQPPNRKPIIS